MSSRRETKVSQRRSNGLHEYRTTTTKARPRYSYINYYRTLRYLILPTRLYIQPLVQLWP